MSSGPLCSPRTSALEVLDAGFPTANGAVFERLLQVGSVDGVRIDSARVGTVWSARV